QCREIARTVPPRQVAFKDRECEAWIRRVAKDGLVELHDLASAIPQFLSASDLSRIGLNAEIHAGWGLDAGGGHFRPHESTHDERQIAQRLRTGEFVQLSGGR